MAPQTRLADSAGRGRLPKADPQGLLGGPVCHFEAMPKACCFCDSGQQRQPKSSNVPKRGQGERVISEKGQPGGGLPGDTGHISWGTSLGLYVKAPQSCPPDKDEQPGGTESAHPKKPHALAGRCSDSSAGRRAEGNASGSGACPWGSILQETPRPDRRGLPQYRAQRHRAQRRGRASTQPHAGGLQSLVSKARLCAHR